MKKLLLLSLTILCPLAIARGQYVYYGPCACSPAQARAAYEHAQRAQAAYQRWQAENYQRAQANQRAWAEAYQRQQAAAYARAQSYQRARADAYMRSQAQGWPATQRQRQAYLAPVIIGGRVVLQTGAQAVRRYLSTPEGRRKAVEIANEAVNAFREVHDRQEVVDRYRDRDRQLERAAVRSEPRESSGIRNQIGELAPRIERRDLDRFAGWGSKGLNDRIGSGQTKERQDRSRSDSSKSGNSSGRTKEIKDWQPRG